MQKYIDELKYYFLKNKKIYLVFLLFFLIGIIVGVFVSISTDSYFSLLTTKDKVFFDYVNGKIDFGRESTKLALSLLVFQIIVFVLNLNIYMGLLSFVLISYQGVILYLSLSVMISQYGFAGVLTVVFLILPVNIIMITLNILFSVFCFCRSVEALKVKRFTFGFDNKFYWVMLISIVILGLVFSYTITFILALLLRRRSFIIF